MSLDYSARAPRTVPDDLVWLAEIAPVLGPGAMATVIEILSDWLVWGEALHEIRQGCPCPQDRAARALAGHGQAREVGR